MKKQAPVMQWKVITDVHILHLERTLQTWTGRGWTVVQVLGPHGNLAVVLQRYLAKVPMKPAMTGDESLFRRV